MSATITNWVYESPASLRAKAKELEKIKQLKKQ